MQNYLSVLDSIQLRWRICRLCRNQKPGHKGRMESGIRTDPVYGSTEKMPAFLRTTDSVEREFSVPEEYLEKQEKFEQKKAEMLSKWNENFLSQDMSLIMRSTKKQTKRYFS